METMQFHLSLQSLSHLDFFWTFYREYLFFSNCISKLKIQHCSIFLVCALFSPRISSSLLSILKMQREAILSVPNVSTQLLYCHWEISPEDLKRKKKKKRNLENVTLSRSLFFKYQQDFSTKYTHDSSYLKRKKE